MAESYTQLTKKEQEIALKQIKAELAKTRREMQIVSKDMEREKKRLHISKLINAGRVVEDAGVLDGYNENSLYLLLVMNKEYLLSKDELNSSGKFDIMHGLASLA